jgi:serine/threonine-protein kinase
MLTGTRPFRGDTATDMLAAVLKEERSGTVFRSTCEDSSNLGLEKDPHDDVRDIGDVPLLLDRAPIQVARRRELDAGGSRRRRDCRGCRILVLAGGRTPSGDQSLIRLSADLGSGAVVGDMITAAISPDGSRIAFPVATNQVAGL